MWRLTTLLALIALTPAAGAPVERIRPGECVAPDAEVDLAKLASNLGTNSVACTSEEECMFKVDLAEDFSIQYFPGYKTVTNNQADPPYVAVLYPCNKGQPAASNFAALTNSTSAEIAYFQIPLFAVATDDTTAGWALESLGLGDRVRYAPAFATSPCMMRVASATNSTPPGCGRAFTSSTDEFATGAPTPLMNFDAHFAFSFSREYDPKLKQIPFTAAADPSPLARTQHLVYMGAFFNKEDVAQQEVDRIANAYNELTTEAGANAPNVLWVSHVDDLAASDITGPNNQSLSGDGFTLSFAAYKTQLTQDAGAAFLPIAQVKRAETGGALQSEDAASENDDVTFVPALYGSRAAGLQALHSVLKQVDILIDESFILEGEPSEAQFMKAWGIQPANKADFPFLAQRRLWRHDKDQTTNGDDWFGEAVIHPDVVLRDMRKVVAPQDPMVANHKTVFFRNIAKGEKQTMTTSAKCSGLTCSSWMNQMALPVADLIDSAGSNQVSADAAETEAGSAAPTGQAATGAAAAVKLGAVTAAMAAFALAAAF